MYGKYVVILPDPYGAPPWRPIFFGVPGMARGVRAPLDRLWWPVDDLEVEVLYGPW